MYRPFLSKIFDLFRFKTLSQRVFLGMFLGLLFGALLQNFSPPAVTETIVKWVHVIGAGYIKLLKMILMPLVFVSILGAVLKVDQVRSLGKISLCIIAVLLGTTGIAALIGIVVTLWFDLDASKLLGQERTLARGQELLERSELIDGLSFPEMLIRFVPNNPFSDLAGSQPTSVINVVIFSILLGIAALRLRAEKPELSTTVFHAMDALQAWIIQLVRLVIQLSPYGVFALMFKMAATSSWSDIQVLSRFLFASYIALVLVLVVHAFLLLLVRVSPWNYFKKVFPVLTFAFSSRSSAATIPLNIEKQIHGLKNHPAIANLSASFGSSIGQNGCAGVYPAMLAIMLAPTMGVPITMGFVAMLVGIVTISSLGVAGIGGGATFAAIIVLSAIDFPVELAGILIAIEPLIDMGRTAVNVNGSMTTGTFVHKILRRSIARDECFWTNQEMGQS